MTQNQDRQIQDYLNNNLPDSERQDFEKRMTEDQELASMVRDLQAIETGLHAVAMDDLVKDMQQWEQGLAVQKHAVGWKKYLAVAAVITLVLIPAVYLLTAKKPTSDELFLSYYEPYEEMLTSRGDTADSLGILLADGMEAYNQGAYQLCSELLQTYLNQRPEDHRVALYLGIAQLETNQMELAESNFQKAQQDPSFKQQAQWYQALSYLKFQERDKARNILNVIATSDDHFRKSQAESLLKQLE
jgi:hypothetical protein